MSDRESANQRPERLLVVDDDTGARERLRQFLETKGYEVALASNGQQAMDLADRTSLDLVLLALSLPNGHGIDVLKHLRGEFSPGELPVIMVTPDHDTGGIVEALTFGANDYISKPIEPGVAMARIKTQLARRRFERELRAGNDPLAGRACGPPPGCRWSWNLETNLVSYSPAWKAMVGCVNGEVGTSHQEWLGRVHPEDRPRLDAAIQLAVEPLPAETCPPLLDVEHRLRRRDGTYVWVHASGRVISAPSASRCLVGSLSDISSRKALAPGSQLPSEHQFLDWMAVALAPGRVAPERQWSLALFGVDRLPAVRQGLGEAAAADLMRHFADGFRSWMSEARVLASACLPAGATVQIARLNDAEFAVLIGGCTSDADVVDFAHRIQEDLDVSVKLSGSRMYASLSAGLIPDLRPYASSQEVLRDARVAVDQSRAVGRGQALTFLPAMRKGTVNKLELEHDLRNAVERREFEIYYQPKVHLEAGQLVGFEALIRWRHPRRGMVPPAEFISLAEDTGLIVPIGDWVLEEACRQTRQWQVRFPAHSGLGVCVNVSSRQLEDAALVKRVAQVLGETGLPPGSLALEITESALVSDGPEVRTLLDQFRAMNIGLHIDDFGTGYSGLQYLQRLPFDTLKIDKSFVDRLGATRETTEITRAIIALAHQLHMEVVSEGIETQEQLNILRDFGSHIGQGYLFSRPLSREQAEELLEHGFEFDMEALLMPD